MRKSSAHLSAGARSSRLSILQSEDALQRLRTIFPWLSFELVPFSSPGDRDRNTDLRDSAPDFFTRDIDEALLSGKIDLALHSAKDVPENMPEGLDWFWLPWKEDTRDVIVLRKGLAINRLPSSPVVGISSSRREEFAHKRFPCSGMKTLRGSIEERIAKLDSGEYDLIILAAAGLRRLGLEKRISEYVPLRDLPTPEGQGSIALVFRRGDNLPTALRSFFIRPAVFAGSGPAGPEFLTAAALGEMRRCEVCLHDELIEKSVVGLLPPSVVKINVGKRSGNAPVAQDQINILISKYVRQGRKVLRLKAGDPGIFGRLAEEIAAIEKYSLPYRVLPGISSLSAASTATGLLLTRRDMSRGFTALTPRAAGSGALVGITSRERKKLPLVLFMSLSCAKEIAGQLMRDGISANESAAVVFNAGSVEEKIVFCALGGLHDAVERSGLKGCPGLIIIGKVASEKFAFRRNLGALQGLRILLLCSEDVQQHAVEAVLDYGGIPVPLPMIRTEQAGNGEKLIELIPNYGWIILTSPSSVRHFMETIKVEGFDIRRIPKIMSCGPATSAALAAYGLNADLEPDGAFNAEALAEKAAGRIRKGTRILRLASDIARKSLSRSLKKYGLNVDEFANYRTVALKYDKLPEFDAAFFASGSAVDAFIGNFGAKSLEMKIVAAIGRETAGALEKSGIAVHIVPSVNSAEAAISSLAVEIIRMACVKST